MKQIYVSFAHAIERRDARAFEPVAALAGKRQIISVMSAAQRLRVNVFDRKRIGTMVLRRLAILAMIPRPRENKADRFCRNAGTRHKSGDHERVSLRTPDHLLPQNGGRDIL